VKKFHHILNAVMNAIYSFFIISLFSYRNLHALKLVCIYVGVMVDNVANVQNTDTALRILHQSDALEW